MRCDRSEHHHGCRRNLQPHRGTAPQAPLTFAAAGYYEVTKYNVTAALGGTTTVNVELEAMPVQIVGSVVNAATQNALSGVTIMPSYRLADGNNPDGRTDGNGDFVLQNVPRKGTYTISAVLGGYRMEKIQVTVDNVSPAPIHFKLAVAGQ